MVDFPKLDLKNGTFIQNLDNPIEGALMEFGIPSCLLGFGKDLLSLLPTDALGGLALGIQEGKESAQNAVADGLAWAFRDLGILEVDADTGKLKFLSSSSRYGIDAGWAKYPGLLLGALDQIQDFYSDAQDILTEIESCIDQTEDWFRLLAGEETGLTDTAEPSDESYTYGGNRAGEFLIANEQFKAAVEFSERCTSSLNLVAEVLAEREVQEAAVAAEEATAPIFRLVFGPPEAKKGQFLLSKDGLYYNSQTRTYADGSPVPTQDDLGIVLSGDKWALDYDPNLGGKGTTIALSELGDYVDTFFDPDKVNDSPSMTEHYKLDHFLQVLESQKNKEVYDLSGHVNSLVASGYDAKSALVVNYQQSIFASIDRHNEKIKKRKKQIEVAVLANELYGSDQTFAVGDQIPINDFSYLSGINLDVDIKKQRQLVFSEGEVNGVVLPIRTTFVRSARAEAQVLRPPLVVPPVGAGGIISLGEFSGTDAPVLSLTDHIVTDDLFAIYNFLNPDVVGANSTEYKLLNCANKVENNAQLITDSPEKVFDKGLGVAQLKGIARHRYKDSTVYLSGLGSVVKLPDTADFQDFLYDGNGRGASIDTWVHIPNYGSLYSGGVEYTGNTDGTTVDSDSGYWTDYNYYKLLLACENTGGDLQGSPTDMLVQGLGTKATKGLVMGFSRDPQIYSTERLTPGSDTDPASGLLLPASATAASSCFFLATTQSVNTNDVEFPSVSGPSPNQKTYLKMVVDASSSTDGVKFNDVSGTFIHINVSFDPTLDEVRIHLDGTLMATSAMSDVFGVVPKSMPRIPTFISPASSTVSSFYYFQNDQGNSVQQYETSSFNEGPNNYENSVTESRWTPWIVGGGWTDGMKITSDTGGFMANKHGYRSALDGYVGSLKFYSKALTNTEVLTNYNAQKAFFKNIKI